MSTTGGYVCSGCGTVVLFGAHHACGSWYRTGPYQVQNSQVSPVKLGVIAQTPLCPDLCRSAYFGEADNLRGRVVLAFFRMLDRVWPVK